MVSPAASSPDRLLLHRSSWHKAKRNTDTLRNHVKSHLTSFKVPMLLLIKSIHQHSSLTSQLSSPQPKRTTMGCKRTFSKSRFGEFFYFPHNSRMQQLPPWVQKEQATCQKPHRYDEPSAKSQSSPSCYIREISSEFQRTTQEKPASPGREEESQTSAAR